MNHYRLKSMTLTFFALLPLLLFSCSNNEFKADSKQLIKSKDVKGILNPGATNPIFAQFILRVRPDQAQKIKIGEIVRYQAFLTQDDGLSSDLDVTEKVQWRVVSGSEHVSLIGIANKTFGIKGTSPGQFSIAASLLRDTEAALESNVVFGEVMTAPVINQVCAYGPWIDGPCSKSCGGGTQTSKRHVTIQPPALLCDDIAQSKTCNENACPPNPQPIQCSVKVDTAEIELGKPIVATIEQSPQDPASIYEIKLGDISFSANRATFTPAKSGKITATVLNAAGLVDCAPASFTVKQPEQPPLPSCNLIVDKSRLPFGGGTVMVKVQSTNVAPVDHFYIDAQEGQTRSINITQTTVIRGSAENASGSVACAPVTVDVLPPPPPAPTCSLKASQESLPSGGGDVQFDVDVSGSAEKVILDGSEGISRSIKISSSRIVEATVQNQSGSNKCNVAINVAAAIATGIPTCTLTLSQSALPANGGAVTATLAVNGNYTTAAINGVIGLTLMETIKASKSYQGIVENASGKSSCSATVTVATAQAPTCALSIDKSSLPATGGEVTLTLAIDGTVDSTSIDGTMGTTVKRNVSASKQFTAIVSNPGGSSSCATYVDVAPKTYCTQGPAGRVMLITTDLNAANTCRDQANAGPFASPQGIDCSGDPSFVLSVSECNGLAQHAVWKHRSVQNAGKCVRFNPLKCYQGAQVYWNK